MQHNWLYSSPGLGLVKNLRTNPNKLLHIALYTRAKFGKIYGICNHVDDLKSQRLITNVAQTRYDLEVIGFVPTDQEIARRSLMSQSISDITDSSAFESAKKALQALHI